MSPGKDGDRGSDDIREGQISRHRNTPERFFAGERDVALRVPDAPLGPDLVGKTYSSHRREELCLEHRCPPTGLSVPPPQRPTRPRPQRVTRSEGSEGVEDTRRNRHTPSEGRRTGRDTVGGPLTHTNLRVGQRRCDGSGDLNREIPERRTVFPWKSPVPVEDRVPDRPWEG